MKQDLKNRIVDLVTEDLASIETALRANLTPHVTLVSDIAGHLLFSGGKRLRPLLFILSSRLCGYDRPATAIQVSTLFEYLHAATLLHDDVVDQAALRRGKPVAHTRWGAPEVVLTGDFLLARSLSLAAGTGIPELINVIASITEDMSQGEIDQLAKKGKLDLTEDEYMDVIRRKTAVLIQGACRSGAIIANAPEPEETALTAYGYHLGMAFQMADDLLDYTAEADTLGKNPGADIREGKLTLPLTTALKNASDDHRKEILAMIGNPAFTQEDFSTLVDLLHRYDGISYTRDKAVTHIHEAKKALGMFPTSRAGDIMTMLADYAIARHV